VTNLSAPLHVDFSITGKCQLRCKYCSAMPLGDRHAPTQRSLALLDELRQIGVFSLLLSGGEPTIHPAFLTLASASAEAVPHVMINTNGIRLSREQFARQLKNASPNAVIAISLDSPDLAANNSNRGTGGSLAVQAIENCAAVGLVVCISAVLTKSTIDSAADLVERFSPIVKSYKFFPWVPRNNGDILLNDESYLADVDAFYASLHHLAQRYPSIELLTPVGNAADKESSIGNTSRTECICAKARLYINSKFETFPCYYCANGDNLIGTCELSPLRLLWNSDRALAIRARAERSRLCGASLAGQQVPTRYQAPVSAHPAQ